MARQDVRGSSKDLNPNQGNSALYGTVITSQEEASSTAYNDAFEKVLRLLRRSFDQVSVPGGQCSLITSPFAFLSRVLLDFTLCPLEAY